MATFKPLLGWGMAVVLLGIPGARLGFLYRARASAQRVEPGPVGRTADIARADEALALSPDLDDASSSGAPPQP
jgi:hypothetical protein